MKSGCSLIKVHTRPLNHTHLLCPVLGSRCCPSHFLDEAQETSNFSEAEHVWRLAGNPDISSHPLPESSDPGMCLRETLKPPRLKLKLRARGLSLLPALTLLLIIHSLDGMSSPRNWERRQARALPYFPVGLTEYPDKSNSREKEFCLAYSSRRSQLEQGGRMAGVQGSGGIAAVVRNHDGWCTLDFSFSHSPRPKLRATHYQGGSAPSINLTTIIPTIIPRG